MYITVTVEFGKQCFDLKLDNGQTLAQGVQALQNAGKCTAKRVDFYKSSCSLKVISAYQPLVEQNIYSGDFLRAVE